MAAGDGIVVGGALGVDFVATLEALKHDPDATRIRIIIPTSLDRYQEYFLRQLQNTRSKGDVTPDNIKALFDVLGRAKSMGRLTELDHDRANKESFHDRNLKIVDNANLVFAYRVNNSTGTQNTIDHARRASVPVKVRSYEI